MALAEHDDVVEALATDRSDESLHVRRLPGRTICDDHFLDTHVLDSLAEEIPIDGIAITNQKPWRSIIGKRFDDLLSRPLGCRMCGDIEMHDVSSVVPQNHKSE